jgi:hypothetical protein
MYNGLHDPLPSGSVVVHQQLSHNGLVWTAELQYQGWSFATPGKSPIPNFPATVNQQPPAYCKGWMVGGQETLFPLASSSLDNPSS